MQLNQYAVEIIKSGCETFEAATADEAEDLARASEGEGGFSLDLTVIVTPVEIAGIPVKDWARILREQHGIEVYEASDAPGSYGFTGCDADEFESLGQAVEAAITTRGIDTRQVKPSVADTHNASAELLNNHQAAAGFMAYGIAQSHDKLGGYAALRDEPATAADVLIAAAAKCARQGDAQAASFERLIAITWSVMSATQQLLVINDPEVRELVTSQLDADRIEELMRASANA